MQRQAATVRFPYGFASNVPSTIFYQKIVHNLQKSWARRCIATSIALSLPGLRMIFHTTHYRTVVKASNDSHKVAASSPFGTRDSTDIVLRSLGNLTAPSIRVCWFSDWYLYCLSQNTSYIHVVSNIWTSTCIALSSGFSSPVSSSRSTKGLSMFYLDYFCVYTVQTVGPFLTFIPVACFMRQLRFATQW